MYPRQSLLDSGQEGHRRESVKHHHQQPHALRPVTDQLHTTKCCAGVPQCRCTASPGRHHHQNLQYKAFSIVAFQPFSWNIYIFISIYDAKLLLSTAKPSNISCELHYENNDKEDVTPELFTCNWKHNNTSLNETKYTVLWVASLFFCFCKNHGSNIKFPLWFIYLT